MMHLHVIISKNSGPKGSQPIIKADFICIEYELGVPTVGCVHLHINNRIRDHLLTCTQGTLYVHEIN